jgi:arylsulfatase A-like enzyme
MRLSVANAMRFVDDVFDETMQAIKDAGQWENTIVLFTSDNGGA